MLMGEINSLMLIVIIYNDKFEKKNIINLRQIHYFQLY